MHSRQPELLGRNLWNLRDARGQPTIQHLIAQARQGGGKVLVVSHGLAIAAVVDTLAPGNDYPLHKPLANASITEVVYRGGRFEVLTFNELKYVKAGQAAAQSAP